MIPYIGHDHPFSHLLTIIHDPMDFHPREYRPRSVKSHDKCPEAATHDRSPLPRPSAFRRHVYIQDILQETIARSKSVAQVQEPNVVDDHKQTWWVHDKHNWIRDSTALPRRKGRPFDRPWCLELDELGMRWDDSNEYAPFKKIDHFHWWAFDVRGSNHISNHIIIYYPHSLYAANPC